MIGNKYVTISCCFNTCSFILIWVAVIFVRSLFLAILRRRKKCLRNADLRGKIIPNNLLQSLPKKLILLRDKSKSRFYYESQDKKKNLPAMTKKTLFNWITIL